MGQQDLAHHDCLSKPHLISQDTIQTMHSQAHHPPQPLEDFHLTVSRQMCCRIYVQSIKTACASLLIVRRWPD